MNVATLHPIAPIIGGRTVLALVVCALAASPRALDAQSVERACRVYGLVQDELGAALWNAWVTVRPLDADAGVLAGATSSPAGAFSLEVPGCERVLVEVTLIGYGSASETVTFSGPGEQVRRTYSLTRRPIDVAPLFVDVSRSARLDEVGFYDRAARLDSIRRDYADFFDRREVEGRALAFPSVTAIVNRSRIRFVYGGGNCRAAYYLDGIEIDRRYSFGSWLHHLVGPEDVEGIEIYRALWGAIPDEYRSWRSNVCGLVLIWTKDDGS